MNEVVCLKITMSKVSLGKELCVGSLDAFREPSISPMTCGTHLLTAPNSFSVTSNSFATKSTLLMSYPELDLQRTKDAMS